MRNKIVIISSLLLLLTFGFLYVNNHYSTSGKYTSSCSCPMHNSNTQNTYASSKWTSYDFVTDKACCDQMRSSMHKELMGLTGVKDVKFGPSCSVSKMSQVSIYYSSTETNSENIASFLKDKKLDCSDPQSCSPDKMNQCPQKEKNKESKRI